MNIEQALSQSTIVVVTHNELPPSQGGKRIAFATERIYYDLRTRNIYPLEQILGQQAAANAPSKPTASGKQPSTSKSLPRCDDYGQLPYAAHSDGECVKCGGWPNESVLHTTNIGMTMVVVCSNCETKMLPRT